MTSRLGAAKKEKDCENAGTNIKNRRAAETQTERGKATKKNMSF